jgi:hypothetical protein
MEGKLEQKEARKVTVELNEDEVRFLLGVIDNHQSKLSIFNDEHLGQKKACEFIGHKIYNQVAAQLPKEEEPKKEEENG